MSISVNASSAGSMAWKGFNTLLGAAGTAMGATALGSKCSEEKVREIIREENGCGRGVCNGYNGGLRGFNETVVVSQPCSENTHVNRYELGQTQEISRLQAKEYSDMSDLKLFEDYTNRFNAARDYNSGRFETIHQELVASRERMQAEICRIDKEVALNNQKIEDNLRFLDYKIDNNQREMYVHVDCKTLPLEKKLPLSSICPQPLAGCVPVGFQGQVITTTGTGETNTVISAAKSATVKA